MKVSELTVDYMINYIKIDEPCDETQKEVEAALMGAKAYVMENTGLLEKDMDDHEDITIAVMVLAADMYENRNLYLDYKYKETNRTVSTILGMHSINLI